MNNHLLFTEMQTALHSATYKIYIQFMRRCIIGAPSEDKHLLLNTILNEVALPDQVFKLYGENEMAPYYDTSILLINKKVELDTFIEKVLTECEKENYKQVTFLQFDTILEKVNPLIKPSYKIHLYELLTDGGFYPYMLHAEDYVFPLQKISENYKTISYCIDQALTTAAYYARWRTFEHLWTTQKFKGLHWKFEPSTNREHAQVLKWIQVNVKRAEEDVDALLGWGSGPDSGSWPSTHLCDYQRTLNLLYESMK